MITQSLVPLGEDCLTDYERNYCTPGAQRGIRAIRQLDDEALLALARCDAWAAAKGAAERAAWVHVHAATGPVVNPTWITTTAAGVAYERGLMGEAEMDLIVGE